MPREFFSEALILSTDFGPSSTPVPSTSALSAMHRAIYCYDVLCMILEENLGQNGATLANSVLVCRTWSGPALRFLWRNLPSFQPIWHLFAPPDLPYTLYNTNPWSYVLNVRPCPITCILSDIPWCSDRVRPALPRSCEMGSPTLVFEVYSQDPMA